MTRKIINFCLIITAVFLFAGRPAPAQAAGATLYLSPASGAKTVNSTFAVGIKVNSGGNVINAAEGTLSYNADLLEAVSVSKNGSIFPFWTAEPSASGGAIRFGGGLPPPAFNGASGHIISVNFKAKKAGEAKINFNSGAVLANDGKGTNIISGMGGASFTIGAAAPAPAKPAETAKPAEPAKPVEKDYNKPVIKSSTHPDESLWYKEKEAGFFWELPAGVSGLSFVFDQNEKTDPGTVSGGVFSEKAFAADQDGIWYLHLRFQDASRWGTAAHFRVNIDSTPPEELKIELIDILPGQWPTLRFAASDALSGLSKYLIHVGNLAEQSYDLPPEAEELALSGLEAGDHVVMVRAIDRAGNERVETVSFRIEPIASPVITNYPGELKSNDNFYVSGTAAGAVLATIHIERGGQIVTSATTSVDPGGGWFLVLEEKLANGRYTVWAEAENENGIGSLPSEQKTFLVSPPVFMMIGDFVINYFTVFASLLFLVIIIILIVFLIVFLIRKKLRKETFEVEEVLNRNAEAMKQAIEAEFANVMTSKLKSERARSKDRLLAKVEENKNKTLKEIKDVEDILK